MWIKYCNSCGKGKGEADFHKMTSSPDGRQPKCKSCMKSINRDYRTENPNYQLDWQRRNSRQWMSICTRWRKADKSSKIYYIKSPEGMYYIGMTNTHLGVRWLEHRQKYKRFLDGKPTSVHPLLFNSFDKWGIGNHQIGILFESDNIDRETLRIYEKSFIKVFMERGIALNKQL